MDDKLRIGVLGLGVVGGAVVKILKENESIITARAGKKIEVVKGVTREPEKAAHLGIEVSTDADFVLKDESIDVVVELMGGIDFPYAVVKDALKSGKSVVTANKAMLAYHRSELEELAKNLHFGYEASVAGGIPVIYALRDGLAANHILSIKGIVNGTCNYILTRMMKEGAGFAGVLSDAQRLGYAEADPTLDVGGGDAAHKLLILASIAYGIDAKPEDILIEGITEIESDDIEFAKDFGYVIKLLAVAKKRGGTVELRVHPALISEEHILADVDGVMNAVAITGDKVGETMFYGAGAGGDATASAVIANLIEIARSESPAAMMGFNRPLETGLNLASKGDIEGKYYIRIEAKDEVGVLGKIAAVLADNGISIENFKQKNKGDSASLLFSTHEAKEANIQKALEEASKLSCIAKKPNMIRIEG
ncbi:MAG: homoserine dehydrogenase [Campylobacterales bacterium]